MSNPYIGEIRMFPGNFAPLGWAFCDGSLQPIAENAALFSLLGTTYGGDGQTTFALPDLRGRVPVHQGPGFVIGQNGGAEQVTLSVLATGAMNASRKAVCWSGTGGAVATAIQWVSVSTIGQRSSFHRGVGGVLLQHLQRGVPRCLVRVPDRPADLGPLIQRPQQGGRLHRREHHVEPGAK